MAYSRTHCTGALSACNAHSNIIGIGNNSGPPWSSIPSKRVKELVSFRNQRYPMLQRTVISIPQVE
eukprot:11375162-Karenia_brevis.AAC.1